MSVRPRPTRRGRAAPRRASAPGSTTISTASSPASAACCASRGRPLLTVGVMAVALALPLGLWLALDNVERFAGNVQQSREISVFLKPDIDADARAARWPTELRGARRRRPRSNCARREQGLRGTARAQRPRRCDRRGRRESAAERADRARPTGDEAAAGGVAAATAGGRPGAARRAWRQRLDGWLRFGGRAGLGAGGAARPRRAAGGRQYRAPGHPVAARGDRRAAAARRHRRLHPPAVPVSRCVVRPGRRRARARSADARRGSRCARRWRTWPRSYGSALRAAGLRCRACAVAIVLGGDACSAGSAPAWSPVIILRQTRPTET